MHFVNRVTGKKEINFRYIYRKSFQNRNLRKKLLYWVSFHKILFFVWPPTLSVCSPGRCGPLHLVCHGFTPGHVQSTPYRKRTQPFSLPDKDGQTPLHLATNRRITDGSCVKYILKASFWFRLQFIMKLFFSDIFF